MDELVDFTDEQVIEYHARRKGKLEVMSKTPLNDKLDLSLAYTPGVAKLCNMIAEDASLANKYTNKANSVAVVTDGTAVLGLGDIGPVAALPVMEGKAILFKMLAGVDAYPICLATKDTEEIIQTVKNLEPSFGGINLEDINAPHCFDIETRLRAELDIPVFHDDQHGTAIVMLAGLINALKVVDKDMKDIKVVFNGAGAAGIACAKFYMSAGVKDVILCDSKGVIYDGRSIGMNPYKDELAKITNKKNIQGTLADVMDGADVFIGLSVGNVVTRDMVSSMADDAIVFPCANPIPEIMPEDAEAAGAKVIATGRSDYPNQLNNVLGFPGIFRGALDTMASDVNEPMKLAAAHAIASAVPEDELSPTYILIDPLHPDIMAMEAREVARAAIDSGVARADIEPHQVEENCKLLVAQAKKRFIA